jgi:hypothetical protein
VKEASFTQESQRNVNNSFRDTNISEIEALKTMRIQNLTSIVN